MYESRRGSTTGPSPILRWFDHSHLANPELVNVSRRFEELAKWIEDSLPAGAERSTAHRKLLEAKDAAVRAAIEGLELSGTIYVSPELIEDHPE